MNRIRTRHLLAALTLLLVSFCALAAPIGVPPLAAPAGLPMAKLNIDFKQAQVGNVYRIIAHAARMNVYVDDCVTDKPVDIRLMNAPLPLVLDTLAAKLDVSYSWSGSTLRVNCGAAPEPPPDMHALDAKRLKLDFHDASPQKVLDALAVAAGLDRAVIDGSAKNVTFFVDDVRASTAVRVLADEAGLDRVWIDGRVLHACSADACPR